jgi:hypothetical protein
MVPVKLPADPREQVKQLFPVYLADPILILPTEDFEYDPLVGQQTIAVIQGFDLPEQVEALNHPVLNHLRNIRWRKV